MKFSRTIYIWAVMFCLSSQNLYAQTSDSPLSVVQQVEAHNVKGLLHYEKEEFPEAISEMLKAYHLIPEPGLLYNVARIYHKMNERELAQKYYRKFVGHEDADPENVKQALAYIQEITAVEKKAKETAVAHAAAAQLEKEKQAAVVTSPPPIKLAAPKTCLPCWLVMGMTTGTLGVGATTGYLALLQKEAFGASFDKQIRAKAARKGQQYALLSDISWASAGVLSAVAVFLFYRHAEKQSVEVTRGPE